LGLRWKFDKDIWIGVERSFEDDEYWGRIWLDEVLPEIYAWGRFREDGESEAGLGWMLSEHLFWELYYDSRDEDDLSFRIIGNL
jgi:anti-sigma regulatory factor (Ser/Thr protein kinase)